jgi:hypothetical protein
VLTFKDATGHEWTLAITFGSLKRVRDLAGLDLLGADLSKAPGLAGDPFTFFACLYAAIKPACDADGLSSEDFSDRLDGAAYRAAVEAWTEELTRFFREAGQPAVAAALAKGLAVSGLAQARAEAELSDPATDAAIAAQLDQAAETFRSRLNGTTPAAA